MKRKIALLICCLMLSSAAVGCNSSDKKENTDDTISITSENQSEASVSVTDESSTSNTSENSVSDNNSNTSATGNDNKNGEPTENTSDTQPDEDEGSIAFETSQKGVSIDEDGNITIDPDAFEDEDMIIVSEDEDDNEDGEGDETNGNSTYMDLSYQISYLPPDNISSQAKLPAAYPITSSEELDNFISQNNTTYSLDVAYSDEPNMYKMSFKERADALEEDYFSMNDMLIVVAPYSKADECDLGNITASDSEIKVEIWAQEPTGANDTGYVCLLVNMDKGIMNGKTITPVINSAYISDEEE